MGLLDGIEKLINEHGSAIILKERIALANDKYAILESKVTVLEERITELEAKNDSLYIENETLQFDHSKSREQIKKLEEQLAALTDKLPVLFDKRTGTWIDKNTSIHYCPKCKASAISSPMKDEQYGWRCSVCNTYFNNPDNPQPVVVQPLIGIVKSKRW